MNFGIILIWKDVRKRIESHSFEGRGNGWKKNENLLYGGMKFVYERAITIFFVFLQW